jgi:methylated-DNA-[protein]-cysteine S-methyltransferase
MNLMQMKIKSNIGSLYMVSSNLGLRGIFWEKQDVEMFKKNTTLASKYLLSGERQILEYLEGGRDRFDLPLDIIGSVFQKDVWKVLLKIPYGETRSYKEIAMAIKNPKASRAVGTANGNNPLCLIIPCHRVIASDGTLGGYSGGLSTKKKLLKLEENAR